MWISKEAGYCQLDVVVHDNNRYQVKAVLHAKLNHLGSSFAVQDPDAYAAAIIQRQLKRLGIEFTGQVNNLKATARTKLAQHLSKTIA